jgi:hypothetical protein
MNFHTLDNNLPALMNGFSPLNNDLTVLNTVVHAP